MGISLSDLSPKYREQAMIKVAIDESRRRNKSSALLAESAPEQKEPKQNKYHSQKVEGCLADGTPHTFDSVKEFDRYQELSLLERAGEISTLRVQVPFELVPSQKSTDGKTIRPVVYIADFTYWKDGEYIVEDVKGYRSPSSAAYAKFIIKKKLMLWIHHIEIREV